MAISYFEKNDVCSLCIFDHVNDEAVKNLIQILVSLFSQVFQSRLIGIQTLFR